MGWETYRHPPGPPMAENIYSKGTRVWFTDKEQGWISAEVTNVVKGSDDKIKLTFVDDRGKVSATLFFIPDNSSHSLGSNPCSRKLSSTLLSRSSETVKMTCHLYEILLCWRQPTISLRYPILMSPQVRLFNLDRSHFIQYPFSPSYHSEPLCTT